MDSISLQERISNLPQELHDIILAFTLKVETDQIVTVDHSYKSPVQLQINSHSRRTASDIYYSSHTFIIADTLTEPRSTVVRKWLTSLLEEHVDKIKEIRVPYYDIEEAALLRREGHNDPRQLDRRGLLLRMTWRLRYLEFEANFHGVERRWAKNIVLKTDWKDSGRRDTKWFNLEELVNLEIRRTGD